MVNSYVTFWAAQYQSKFSEYSHTNDLWLVTGEGGLWGGVF